MRAVALDPLLHKECKSLEFESCCTASEKYLWGDGGTALRSYAAEMEESFKKS